MTKEQKKIFNSWVGVSRKYYNATVEYLNREDKETTNWMVLYTIINAEIRTEWTDNVPYQIKKIAVRDACQAFKNVIMKAKKTGVPFKLKFRSRKDSRQSCFIPRSAIKPQGIYYTLSGEIRYREKIDFNNITDGRLICEYGKWYINTSVKRSMKPAENQGRVCAIDPGIRTFASYFSSDGNFGQIGYHDFNRISRLCLELDKLIGLRQIAKNNKDRKRIISYGRAIDRVRLKIKNLKEELHNKTALFFAKNFDVVFLPTYNTKDMVCKAGRKITKKSARAMLSFGSYEFAQKLVFKCKEYGHTLIRCNEAYTSKTNSFNGEIMNIGSKESFKYEGIFINRDINGARGILLRALGDTPAIAEMRMDD